MLSEPLILGDPVYAAVPPARFHARGELSQAAYEVLILPRSEPEAALVRDRAVELSGWDHVASQLDGDEILVFRADAVQSLPAAMAAGVSPIDAIGALASLFEGLHVLGDAMLGHASMDWFGLRTDCDDPITAVLRRPESVVDLAAANLGDCPQLGLSPPEVVGALSRDLDARADVFVLGMLGFYLCTGLDPDAALADAAWEMPPLRALVPSAPIGLDRCLRRAVARTPEERYSGVPEFLGALYTLRARHTLRRIIGRDQPLAVEFASHTEIGQAKAARHPVNQDAHLCIVDPKAGWSLFAVMDGVSSCDVGSGELASFLARTELETQWNQKRTTAIYGRCFEADQPFPERFARSLVERAHLRIAAQGLADRGEESRASTACTTVSIALCFGDRCLVASTGDSPVFLLSDQGLDKLTVDHTVQITALRHGASVTSAMEEDDGALGSAAGHLTTGDAPEPAEILVDLATFRLLPGDVLLLCSDGVPDAFGREAEHAILAAAAEFIGRESADSGRLLAFARNLVREADRRGGRDNLTAVAVGVGDYRADHGS